MTTRQLVVENCTKEELINELKQLVSSKNQTTQKQEKVLHIPDVMRILEKSDSHVRSLIRENKLECFQERKGAAIMFRQEFIDDYLKKYQVKTIDQHSTEIQNFINKPFGHDSNKH
tara:strand:+ start:1773 stop:2120 length:348 start_codon:yes stop_codon:yes gene_type:complete